MNSIVELCSISKVDSYVKGTYEFQEAGRQIRVLKMVEKLEQNNLEGRSWVELFFSSDIHIFGFSLDFSETDLWWILTKRARILHESKTNHLVKNRIYFYARNVEPEKRELLRTLNVDVLNPYPDGYGDDWYSYYCDVIEQIAANPEELIIRPKSSHTFKG
jgi:hypothetical protein